MPIRSVRALKERIGRYRVLARLTSDPEAAERIFDLAADLERQVREIEHANDQAFTDKPTSGK